MPAARLLRAKKHAILLRQQVSRPSRALRRAIRGVCRLTAPGTTHRFVPVSHTLSDPWTIHLSAGVHLSSVPATDLLGPLHRDGWPRVPNQRLRRRRRARRLRWRRLFFSLGRGRSRARRRRRVIVAGRGRVRDGAAVAGRAVACARRQESAGNLVRPFCRTDIPRRSTTPHFTASRALSRSGRLKSGINQWPEEETCSRAVISAQPLQCAEISLCSRIVRPPSATGRWDWGKW